jgi:hypothetical protein
VEILVHSRGQRTRYLGVVPRDWKENRRVAKNVEVVSVVGVLPDVLARENYVLSKGLLDAGVKLRQPGLTRVTPDAENPRSGFKTASLHPVLETIRFSLNGVSSNRAPGPALLPNQCLHHQNL